jgi:hypothetical protein
MCEPPKGLRSFRHPVPPRVLQGSRPSSRSARGGPSLASHHTHALLFVGHARSRSARWPSLPQSPLYSPQAHSGPPPGGCCCWGSARLACARPAPRLGCGLITPLAPMGRARALEGAPAQPRTCTTRSRRKAGRVHVVHRSNTQARDRASPCACRGGRNGPACDRFVVPPREHTRSQGCSHHAGIARTGPSLVVPPATGPHCAPREPGQNTPTHIAPQSPRTKPAYRRQARDPCRLNAPAGPRVPTTRGQMRRLLLCRMVR